MENSSRSKPLQAAIGVGVLALAGVLAWGAAAIPSEAGYTGVGPGFLPWLVAAVLAVCGALLLWQVATGGFQSVEEPSGAAQGDWLPFVWMSSGVLLNALLIEHVGFIISCALCYALAVRGLRLAEGKPTPLPRMGADVLTGVAIAAPVYWMFTQVLAVNLPGLTGTGWL